MRRATRDQRQKLTSRCLLRPFLCRSGCASSRPFDVRMPGVAPFDEVKASFWHADITHGMLSPLTQDMVLGAERELGIALPADLLQLLRIQNGGVVADA